MNDIQTPRLVLRPFTLDDAAFIVELLHEPGWKQFIGDRGVRDLESARGYIQRALLDAYAKQGFGLLAVTAREDGTPLGMCGLLQREGLADVDIGFALLSRYEGQGFAHEAAAATLVYARDVVGIRRVVAITAVNNHRSAKLLQRLGMTYEQIIHVHHDSEPLHLYAIDFVPPTPPPAPA